MRLRKEVPDYKNEKVRVQVQRNQSDNDQQSAAHLNCPLTARLTVRPEAPDGPPTVDGLLQRSLDLIPHTSAELAFKIHLREPE